MGWWGHVERMCELAQAEVSRAAQPSSALSVYLQAHNQKQCVSPQGTEILQLLVILYHCGHSWPKHHCVTVGKPSPCLSSTPIYKVMGGIGGSIKLPVKRRTKRPTMKKEFETPDAQVSSRPKGGAEENTSAGTISRQRRLYPQRYSHKCLAVRPQLWTKSVREEGSAARAPECLHSQLTNKTCFL